LISIQFEFLLWRSKFILTMTAVVNRRLLLRKKNVITTLVISETQAEESFF